MPLRVEPVFTVPAFRQSGPLAQVCTVPAMECLMAAGVAEALVSAGVSVGAGAEVAAGPDLVVGGRSK